MKKYVLTALLGVFGLFGFASANTIDGFTSSSDICKVSNFNSSSISNTVIFGCYDEELAGNLQYEPFYVCVNTSDIPYYVYDNDDLKNIDSSIGCFYSTAFSNDSNIEFYSDSDNNSKTIQGDVYLSTSSITYSSSSEGGDSEGSSSLISGGTAVFSGIISSLGSAVSEFIPYVAYIGIGLLGAIIGFVAIKRLINRVRAKIFGTFSGGRRR